MGFRDFAELVGIISGLMAVAIGWFYILMRVLEYSSRPLSKGEEKVGVNVQGEKGR